MQDYIPNWEDFIPKNTVNTQIFPKGNKSMCIEKTKRKKAGYTSCVLFIRAPHRLISDQAAPIMMSTYRVSSHPAFPKEARILKSPGFNNINGLE